MLITDKHNVCWWTRFRHGNMYMYELPVTTVESFVSFAEGWYKNAASKPVPTEPSPLWAEHSLLLVTADRTDARLVAFFHDNLGKAASERLNQSGF